MNKITLVIQTNPDSLADLRLDSPFPSLSEFVNSFEMDKLDNHEHAHIPAVVIIIHFLEIFKSKVGTI
jgi:amyloid beta precursor protein binding protein 1